MRKRYKGNPWFKRGTVFRNALDVLRRAEKPLTVREITELMLKAKGVANAKSSALNDLSNGVRVSLRKYESKGIVAVVREGMPRGALDNCGLSGGDPWSLEMTVLFLTISANVF
jgi:hypothetical protein